MTRRAQDNTKAHDAFLAAKFDIDAMLERLTALSADHFEPTPTRSIGATLAFLSTTAPSCARLPTAPSAQEALISMLRAEGGASIDEIMAATQWAPHTARGFMSGALKKKLGLTITSEKVVDRGRVYRIAEGNTVASG